MLLVALDTLLYWFLEWCQPAAEVGISKSDVEKSKAKEKESKMTFGRKHLYNPLWSFQGTTHSLAQTVSE